MYTVHRAMHGFIRDAVGLNVFCHPPMNIHELYCIVITDWSTPHRAVPSFHAVDRFLTSSGVSRLTKGVSVYWHMLINIHDADGGRQSIAPCSWRHSWRITAVTGDSYLRIMRIYSLNSINNLLLNYLWTSKHTYEWNLVTFEPTNNRILQY